MSYFIKAKYDPCYHNILRNQSLKFEERYLMSNILQALHRIVESYQENIQTIAGGANRMNNMGEGLEEYIKNIFANTIHEKDIKKKKEKIHQTFSYTGNKNNPPDMILRNGDAIEVKKIQSIKSDLQLNSSHPKAKLHIDNPKINHACKTYESWEEKDILYIVGQVKEKVLRTLWMVYGDCYAAEEETYTKVEQKVKSAIEQIDDLEVNHETNELSGIKNIDPLNITYLRIRGMWIISNPAKVFDYLYPTDTTSIFQSATLMKREKYLSFPEKDRHLIEQHKRLMLENVKISNPNNPADLIDAILIIFKVES